MTVKQTVVIAVITVMTGTLAIAQPIDKAQGGPLKVYILAGQSNMQGHAHVKTLEYVAKDPESKELAALVFDENGDPRTAERTWISYMSTGKGGDSVREGKLTPEFGSSSRGPRIGPEYTFGLTMEKQVSNPILLIKAAWGGRNLNTDFRPPSAGSDSSNNGAGVEYRKIVAHVKDVLANIKRVYPDYDPNQGYEIAGFVWFQGWNDMLDKHTYTNRNQPGGYDLYSELLTHFIKDVRKEFDAPKMPFVIGVIGVWGDIKGEDADYRSNDMQIYFREAMAAPAKLPEFEGNVHAVYTEQFWDKKLGVLDQKWAKAKGQFKNIARDKTLSDEEKKQKSDALRAGVFTPEEQAIYDMAVSQADFHYLGAAKIVGQIGAAFAEAIVAMEQNNIDPASQ